MNPKNQNGKKGKNIKKKEKACYDGRGWWMVVDGGWSKLSSPISLKICTLVLQNK